MGFILILTTIVSILVLLACLFPKNSEERNVAAGWACAVACIGFVACMVILISSYFSFISLKEQQTYVKQYADAIQMYSEKGLTPFNASRGGEITDLKYQNYQGKIGDLIEDYRLVVARYNASLTAKRLYKKNPVFSVLIYLPEDLPLMEMADYVQ